MAEAEHGGGDAIGPAQRGAVRVALRAQAVVLDRLLGAVTRAYEQEQQRAGRSLGQRRAARVRGLLKSGLLGAGEPEHGSGDDPGCDLDYALEGWHVGVIAVGVRAERAERDGWVGQPERAVRELAEGVGCRLLCVEQDEGECVWAWLGAGERLMLADVEGIVSSAIVSVADRRSESASGAGEGVLFALGEPSEGFQGWCVTHLQARVRALAQNSPLLLTEIPQPVSPVLRS